MKRWHEGMRDLKYSTRAKSVGAVSSEGDRREKWSLPLEGFIGRKV